MPTHRLPSVPMHSARPRPLLGPTVTAKAMRSSVISLASISPLPLLSAIANGVGPVEVSMTPLPLRSMKPSARIFSSTGLRLSNQRFST